MEVTIDGPHPEQFEVTQTGSSIVVRQEPSGSWLVGSNRGAHRVTIVAPEAARLEASLASADLAVELLLTSLQADTASGDVRAGCRQRRRSGEVGVGGRKGRGGWRRAPVFVCLRRAASRPSGERLAAHRLRRRGRRPGRWHDRGQDGKRECPRVAVHRRRALGQDGERRLHRGDSLRHRTGFRSGHHVGAGGAPRSGARRAAGGALRPAQLQIGIRGPPGTPSSEAQPATPVLPSLRVDPRDSEEEAAFRAEARSWLERNARLRPRPAIVSSAIVAEWSPEEEEARFQAAVDWQRLKSSEGWAGIAWPTKYGGRGAGLVEAVIFDEEETRFDLSRDALSVGLGWCGPADPRPWERGAARPVPPTPAARR